MPCMTAVRTVPFQIACTNGGKEKSRCGDTIAGLKVFSRQCPSNGEDFECTR